MNNVVYSQAGYVRLADVNNLPQKEKPVALDTNFQTENPFEENKIVDINKPFQYYSQIMNIPQKLKDVDNSPQTVELPKKIYTTIRLFDSS